MRSAQDSSIRNSGNGCNCEYRLHHTSSQCDASYLESQTRSKSLYLDRYEIDFDRTRGGGNNKVYYAKDSVLGVQVGCVEECGDVMIRCDVCDVCDV